MKELRTKGIEELGKVKNRVARLYGMGRISLADFERLNDRIIELENLMKEVEEEDGSDG